MRVLLPLLLLYIGLFLAWGIRDFKKFLLFTGIFTIPFAVDYAFMYSSHSGWTSGVYVRLSDLSFLLLPIVWMAERQDKVHLAPEVSLPVWLFIGICLLSIFNSEAPVFTFFQVVQLVTLYSLYFFVASNALQTTDDLRLVMRFFAVSLIFQGVLSMFQFHTGWDIDFRTGTEVSFMTLYEAEYIRSFGTIGRPNAFGGYINPVILMMQVMLMAGADRRPWLYGLALVLGLTGLIYCFSRGAWASFFVANAFLVFVGMRRRLAGFGRLFAVQLLMGLVLLFLLPVILERLVGEDAGAASSRIPLLKLAWNMISAHPFLGIGVNSFMNVFPRYITPDIAGAWMGEVHNMYLLIFAEAGIFALLVFLWFLWAVYHQAKSLSRATDPFLAALGLGGQAALVAIAAHMLVDMYTGSIMLSLLFFLSGLMTAGNRIRVQAMEPARIEVLPEQAGQLPAFQARPV